MSPDGPAVWECADCGTVEYGEFPPEECNKCWKVNSFVGVPEDRLEEMKDHVLEDIRPEDFDEEDEDDA